MEEEIKTVEYIKPPAPQPTPEEWWRTYYEEDQSGCISLDGEHGNYRIDEKSKI